MGGWFRNIGNKYKVIQQAGVSHSDAVDGCKALNASLVTIDEAIEFDFVNNIVAQAGATGSIFIGMITVEN